ncbi:hypothetical protein D3C72_1045650 [compost metagenome]
MTTLVFMSRKAIETSLWPASKASRRSSSPTSPLACIASKRLRWSPRLTSSRRAVRVSWVIRSLRSRISPSSYHATSSSMKDWGVPLSLMMRLIVCTTWCFLKGLMMKSRAPATSVRLMISSWPAVVTMITRAALSTFKMASSASRPSSLGMLTSIVTRSGRSS